ncbi:hypothetical protein K5X82_07510 [Halosquirtibacter xylanolyticus]|uniref:hypothetical protein n=1 Tax=Halosquirtibacter xylanolyticus TaxID=3374599 RepID=UPI00374948AB|nr:hypothetical protein K5X82_07510 [Prolixibacteraceae bacterium]
MKKSNKLIVGYGIFTFVFVVLLFLLPKFLKNEFRGISKEEMAMLDIEHAKIAYVNEPALDVIDVDSLLKQKPVPLHEKVESYKIIDLERTPQSRLDGQTQYTITTDYIYAYNAMAPYVIVFTAEGKFVRRICRFNDGVKFGLIKSVVFDNVRNELVVLSDCYLFYFTPKGALKVKKQLPINLKKIFVNAGDIYAVTTGTQPVEKLQNKIGNAMIKMTPALKVSHITTVNKSNRRDYRTPLQVSQNSHHRIITGDFGYDCIFSYDMSNDKVNNKYRFNFGAIGISDDNRNGYMFSSFMESNQLQLLEIRRYIRRNSYDRRRFIKKHGDFIYLDMKDTGKNLPFVSEFIGVKDNILITTTWTHYRNVKSVFSQEIKELVKKTDEHNKQLVFMTLKAL